MIRNFVIEDYEEVYQLWAQTTGIGLSETDSRSNIESFLQRNHGSSFVYEEDSKIVGAVLCGHDGRRGYIHHLAVDAKFRDRGIGSSLVSECLAALHNLGIGKCHLFVFDQNVQGQKFWKRIGWEQRENLLIYSKYC